MALFGYLRICFIYEKCSFTMGFFELLMTTPLYDLCSSTKPLSLNQIEEMAVTITLFNIDPLVSCRLSVHHLFQKRSGLQEPRGGCLVHHLVWWEEPCLQLCAEAWLPHLGGRLRSPALWRQVSSEQVRNLSQAAPSSVQGHTRPGEPQLQPHHTGDVLLGTGVSLYCVVYL